MAEVEPYCDRCQLPLVMCAHRGTVPRSAVRAAEAVAVDWAHIEELADQAMTADSRPFEARWAGTCPLCGQRWEPGDSLAWSADEDKPGHAGCVLGEA